MMELVILGSGTCVPRMRRAGPSNLIRIEAPSLNGKEFFNILIDSSAGTLRQLLKIGVSYAEIDLILYTHFHPDHTGDLVPYLFATRYAPGFKRKSPCTIMASEGFKELLAGLHNAFGHWIEPESQKVVVEEIPRHIEVSMQIPPVTLSTLPISHTPHSLAYKIQGPAGKTIVISGDTDFEESLCSFAKGADILVLECARPEGQKVKGHLTPHEAGEIGRAASPGLLVLTHFYPDCDESDMLTPVRKLYDGPVILAEDLQRFPLY